MDKRTNWNQVREKSMDLGEWKVFERQRLCEREIGLENKLREEGGWKSERMKEWNQMERPLLFIQAESWITVYKLLASDKHVLYVRVCFSIRQWYRSGGIVPYAHIILSCTGVQSAQIHIIPSLYLMGLLLYSWRVVCEGNSWLTTILNQLKLLQRYQEVNIQHVLLL